jgi:uncharacterized protein (UPF0248 family)
VSGARHHLPVQDVLHRIRWDPSLSHSEFRIGYYDRLIKDLVEVSLGTLHFRRDDHFGCDLTDDSGETRYLPFHRIKRIYQDGRCIWSRDYLMH